MLILLIIHAVVLQTSPNMQHYFKSVMLKSNFKTCFYCTLHMYCTCTGYISPLEGSAQPYVLPISWLLSHSKLLQRFLQIWHVYLASQQKTKCQIEEEIRSENACRQSVYLQAFAHFPTVDTAHVRLSPAEHLGCGGVSGRDNWGAAYTTWYPQ